MTSILPHASGNPATRAPSAGTAAETQKARTVAGAGFPKTLGKKSYFLPPKPLKRALKRSTRPAESMMRCLPV